jgi:hypothetical protein
MTGDSIHKDSRHFECPQPFFTGDVSLKKPDKVLKRKSLETMNWGNQRLRRA